MISDISIIIPTLNEEPNIRSLGQVLAGQEIDVIVTDGGSTDSTTGVARQYGFRVVEENGGRGAQLNRGAEEAQGNILLFLHADTRLPHDFATQIRTTLSRPNCVAGAFHLAIEQGTPGMHFVAMCANLRSRFLQLPYGDQALFLKKETFFLLGAFPEVPIMEDYIFICQAKKKGKVLLAAGAASTSARRWQRLGVLRTTWINLLMVTGYHLGISPQRLASLYRLR